MKNKSLKNKVFDYINEKYLVSPEYPWEDNTGAVFRQKENRKWFALVMDVGGSKVGLESDDVIPCINLKIDDPVFHDRRELRSDGSEKAQSQGCHARTQRVDNPFKP